MVNNNYSRRKFIRNLGIGTVALNLPHLSLSASESTRKPNIIFILADDLGWAELGCYGNTFNETPNLDRLAKQGMLFTDAYAAAPVCSPYRAALMTGQYPARVGITDYLRPNDKNHLTTEYVTIAEALKNAGYATGIIGKWHLTGYANHGAKEVGPDRHGFDEVIVLETNLDDTSGEILGHLSGLLMEQGALDVFFVPIQMKKQRPGVLLSVLGTPEKATELERLIFTNTGTLGLRWRRTRRHILAREHRVVETPLGSVRLKVGRLGKEVVAVAPEYEDCARLARESGVPLWRVYQAALVAGHEQGVQRSGAEASVEESAP